MTPAPKIFSHVVVAIRPELPIYLYRGTDLLRAREIATFSGGMICYPNGELILSCLEVKE